MSSHKSKRRSAGPWEGMLPAGILAQLTGLAPVGMDQLPAPVLSTREDGSGDAGLSAALTGDEDLECLAVTIHGVRHYLHSGSALDLIVLLNATLVRWEAEGLASIAHTDGPLALLTRESITSFRANRQSVLASCVKANVWRADE